MNKSIVTFSSPAPQKVTSNCYIYDLRRRALGLHFWRAHTSIQRFLSSPLASHCPSTAAFSDYVLHSAWFLPPRVKGAQQSCKPGSWCKHIWAQGRLYNKIAGQKPGISDNRQTCPAYVLHQQNHTSLTISKIHTDTPQVTSSPTSCAAHLKRYTAPYRISICASIIMPPPPGLSADFDAPVARPRSVMEPARHSKEFHSDTGAVQTITEFSIIAKRTHQTDATRPSSSDPAQRSNKTSTAKAKSSSSSRKSSNKKWRHSRRLVNGKYQIGPSAGSVDSKNIDSSPITFLGYRIQCWIIAEGRMDLE